MRDSAILTPRRRHGRPRLRSQLLRTDYPVNKMFATLLASPPNTPDWRYRLCPPPILPQGCIFQLETDGPFPRTRPVICIEIASERSVHTNDKHQ